MITDGTPSETQYEDVEKILTAGLTEAAGVWKDEFRPFIEDFGPVIAVTASRAAAGSESAKVALEQLRAQVKTHQYIAQLRAAGIADNVVELIVGTAIRLALGAMA